MMCRIILFILVIFNKLAANNCITLQRPSTQLVSNLRSDALHKIHDKIINHSKSSKTFEFVADTGIGGGVASNLEQTKQQREGTVCSGPSSLQCQKGLVCTCLALNRGLFVCMKPGLLTPPKFALSYERQGLSCEVHRVPGTVVMKPPPPFNSKGNIIDPTFEPVSPLMLRDWSRSPDGGNGYYTQYTQIVSKDGSDGVPILAPNDVPVDLVSQAKDIVQNMLVKAARSKDMLHDLSKNNIRVLLSHHNLNTEDDDSDDCCLSWTKHPEVKKRFKTGLGGGAPWFPSTGIEDDEVNLLIEELFHTIEYTAMSPRLVCMYRKAYKNAMEKKLYLNDGSANEIDGEPVPTVQADEYLAMALHRWFGSNNDSSEYLVPAFDADKGLNGREILLQYDPFAFCILSVLFSADDPWRPKSSKLTNPAGFPRKHYEKGFQRKIDETCRPVLKELGLGCPANGVTFPNYHIQYPLV
jgi:hypothetical protein